MRTVLAIMAYSGLASGIMAQDAKPAEKYVSKAGKYAVAFPGKPKVEVRVTAGVELHSAIVEKDMGVMSVFYTDVQKGARAKDLLDGGQEGVVENFKAKLKSSKDFEFGKGKYPARELIVEKATTTLRFELILADNRLYQVFVAGPKDMVMGKEADAFLKSFEITK